MTNQLIFSKNVESTSLRSFFLNRLVVLGLLILASNPLFAQIGPYFYGKPDPVTGIPAPPSPATDYYTVESTEGLPKYLDSVSDQINPASNPNFLSQLIAALPEKVDRSTNLGLGDAADLLVKEDNSEIFLVFVTEGAIAKNALGYYFYKGDQAPDDLNAPNPLMPGKSYLESRRIIFPNASLRGPSPFGNGNGGGKLQPGNRVKLIGDQPDGKFTKGVKIAWFIVSYGWDGQQVGNGKYVLYSNPDLNPKKKRQAAVLDFSETEGRNIITFEDTKRSPDGGSDSDFNDVVFYVSQKADGPQTVYYPDCSGKFVLTKAEYEKLPKDETGKLICTTTPPPVSNLSLTAICSDDPTKQLAWRISNPNTAKKPFTWIITDGMTATVKLASTAVVDALPGETIIHTPPVSGTNVMTIFVEGTEQSTGSKITANTVPCDTGKPEPVLNCCVVFPSEVISYQPGTNRVGGAIATERMKTQLVLGPSGPSTSFVSLGFDAGTPDKDASIVLKFPKPVRGLINIYETTFGAVKPDFVKTAQIYGSMDGSTFYKVGTANNQAKGSVDIHRTTLELKGEYTQIQYIKVVDITPKASMPNDADGFHLEGVCASDYALQAVPFDPNAEAGSVKVDKTKIQPTQAKRRDGTSVWSNSPNVNTDPSCVAAGLCDPEGINRSDVNSIMARDDKFYSLGIGGSIVIEFEEAITGSLILFERTGDPKPTSPNGSSINYIEKVAIYVKTGDCSEWGDPIGYADNQGSQLGTGAFGYQTYKAVISLGGRTAKYVKLVDVTPAFSTSTDGYDIDFIASTSNASTSGDDLGPDAIEPQTTIDGWVINAFPNPSNGNLTVDFGYRETGYLSATTTLVTVTDLMGYVVASYVQEANNTEPLQVDLNNQPNGLYFVRVQSGKSFVNQKILLQR